jgi:hypothetical protein
MRGRWFADPAEGERLDETLLGLVGAVSRMLDGLASPPVAPGGGRIDPAASAVVLPHAAVPGCSLVVQVAAWSSSVGCWWSLGTDPRAGPANLELATELPLQLDGLARAVAWVERELRRPVVARDRHYGLARHRQWAVVRDDGYELPIRHRWLLGGGPADEGGRAPAGPLPGPRSWLLGLAAAAALARWALAALTLPLLGASWTGPAARALDLTAVAALLAWFWGAAGQRPSRVRAPMLAGLALATLGAGPALLLGPAEWAPVDPAGRALGLFLREELPTLLDVAALACYLSAFLGLPGRTAPRPPWPRALPVAAGLAWGLDLAVGLWLLARYEPAPGEAALAWYGVLVVAMRAAAVGLALVLGFVLLDRRPAGAGLVAGRPARPELAGLAPAPGPDGRRLRRPRPPGRLRRHRPARGRRGRGSDPPPGRGQPEAQRGQGRHRRPGGGLSRRYSATPGAGEVVAVARQGQHLAGGAVVGEDEVAGPVAVRVHPSWVDPSGLGLIYLETAAR